MQEKYAELLLKGALNISKNQPLLIMAPIECYNFVITISKLAYEMGIKDIYFDWEDETLKKIQLENLNCAEISISPFWNKKIFEEYAKKDAAFLMLTAYEDFSSSKITEEVLSFSAELFRTSRPIYKEKQLSYVIPWCIAGVATQTWADKIFPNSEDNLSLLWETIYKMCLVDQNNPMDKWNEKLKISNLKCDYMNLSKFEFLKITNSKGTDLTIELPKNHVWLGAGKKTDLGKQLIVNMPTEEIFTSPYKFGVNGIVYNSKPLVNNGIIIDDFYIEFKNGKIVDYNAKKGLSRLKQIIETDEGSHYLGEVALVDYNSPISKSGIIFYETLFDENASCHLAIGNAFPKCIDNSKLSVEEYNKIHNISKTHVDFMFGTNDLNVIGVDNLGKEFDIMKDGDFIKLN